MWCVCCGRFQSAPAFEHGGNSREAFDKQILDCFNPPPPSSTGETAHAKLAAGEPDVSIRPRLRARGKPRTSPIAAPSGKFQSAPAFEHGGNSVNCSSRSRPGSRQFQSAPAFEHGGNLNLGLALLRVPVSIRPRLRARGKQRQPRPGLQQRSGFQSAPAFEHGGNEAGEAAAKRAQELFQSAPAFEHGGNATRTIRAVFTRLFQSAPAFEHGGNCHGDVLAHELASFNPPPPSSTGETQSTAVASAVDWFQSAPAFEHGGNSIELPALGSNELVSIRPRLRARGKLRAARVRFEPK